MRKPMLSDGEFEIMECVWKSDKAPTQTDIMRWVNKKYGKNLKLATFVTYIRRIVDKGYLEKVDTGDRRPTYKALVSRDEYYQADLEAFRKRWGLK